MFAVVQCSRYILLNFFSEEGVGVVVAEDEDVAIIY